MAQIEDMKQLADCPLVIVHLVFRFDPTLDIHAAPANQPVLLGIRPLQHTRLHSFFLLRCQPLLWVTAGGIAQSFRPLRVETVNPVTQSLTIHPAVRRRILPARALQNRRYCRQPQNNPAILLLARQLAQITHTVIYPNGYRSTHAMLHQITHTVNHMPDKMGIYKTSHLIRRLV